jgi:hypothetical protein
MIEQYKNKTFSYTNIAISNECLQEVTFTFDL